MDGRAKRGSEGRGRSLPLGRMVGLSVLFHAAGIFLAQAAPSLFPATPYPRAITVELMPPLPEPVAEEAPPLRTAPAARVASAAPSRSANDGRSDVARRWIGKLDETLAKAPAAPGARDLPRPAEHTRTASRSDPRGEDFRRDPAPDDPPDVGTRRAELERAIRRNTARVTTDGPESEAIAMFSGTGKAAEPIPPWIREMIRRKVRERLPDLESAYTAAYRRNPALRGRLVVRFRIDPAGTIRQAEPVGELPGDAPFVATVLDKVRGWTFDPTNGVVVDVLYPFLFIAPS